MSDCIFCDRSIDVENDHSFITCPSGLHCDDHDCEACAFERYVEIRVGYLKDEGF